MDFDVWQKLVRAALRDSGCTVETGHVTGPDEHYYLEIQKVAHHADGTPCVVVHRTRAGKTTVVPAHVTAWAQEELADFKARFDLTVSKHNLQPLETT